MFLLALFWQRMTTAGAIGTLVFGHGVGIAILAWKISSNAGGTPDGLPHFTIVAGITTFACVVVAVAASLLRPAPAPASAAGLMWARRDAVPASRRWDYRWPAAAIVTATLALIWVFR